jgi:hypothetical protein
LLCAYIAVTEGLAQRLPIWSQANVVNRPAIDGNGGDTFGRCLRSFAQAFLQARENCFKRPIHRLRAMDRAVGNAMDNLNAGPAVNPTEQ